MLVEDASELRPTTRTWSRLEARPPNIEGAGEIDAAHPGAAGAADAARPAGRRRGPRRRGGRPARGAEHRPRGRLRHAARQLRRRRARPGSRRSRWRPASAATPPTASSPPPSTSVLHLGARPRRAPPAAARSRCPVRGADGLVAMRGRRRVRPTDGERARAGRPTGLAATAGAMTALAALAAALAVGAARRPAVGVVGRPAGAPRAGSWPRRLVAVRGRRGRRRCPASAALLADRSRGGRRRGARPWRRRAAAPRRRREVSRPGARDLRAARRRAGGGPAAGAARCARPPTAWPALAPGRRGVRARRRRADGAARAGREPGRRATSGCSPPPGRSPTAPATAWPTPSTGSPTRSAPPRPPDGWSRASSPRPAPPHGWSPGCRSLALLDGLRRRRRPARASCSAPGRAGLPGRRAGVRRSPGCGGSRRSPATWTRTRERRVLAAAALAGGRGGRCWRSAAAAPRLRPRARRPRRRRPDARLDAPLPAGCWSLLGAASAAALFVGGPVGPVAGVGGRRGGLVVRRARPSRPRRRDARAGPPRPAARWCGLLGAALRGGCRPRRRRRASACAALPGPAADRLAGVAERLALGRRPGAGLGARSPTTPSWRRSAAPWPAPTRPAPRSWPRVERLADELERAARAEVEDRARAVGVRAALPLGLCLLPAFLLLGIVPLVAGLLVLDGPRDGSGRATNRPPAAAPSTASSTGRRRRPGARSARCGAELGAERPHRAAAGRRSSMTMHRPDRSRPPRRARHHHRRVRRRHRRRRRPRRAALQAAHRRLRRPAAATAVRPRAGAAGDRVSVGSARRAGASGARSPPSWRWPCRCCVAVTVGLVWLLSVGAAQVRVVDAARETARAVARGDDQGAGGRARPAGRARRRRGQRHRGRRARSRVAVAGPGATGRAGCSTFLPGGPAPGRGGRGRGGAAVTRPASRERARCGHACSRSPAWVLLLCSAPPWAWSPRWSRPTGRRSRPPTWRRSPAAAALADGGDGCAAAAPDRGGQRRPR